MSYWCQQILRQFLILVLCSLPQNVIDLTLKKKERNHSETVSTNCLEHAVIIILHNEVLGVFEQLGFFAEISHPKASIKADNTTTDSWSRKMASSCIIGKTLNTIFCKTLMNQALGVDSLLLSIDYDHCADVVWYISKGSLFIS